MSVPTWAIALTIELIILLLLVVVFLAIGWRLSCRKKQKLVDKLQSQNYQQENTQSSPEKTTKQPAKESNDLKEEVELLKIQLEQARDNPFLQEKIDALTAENEDLQAQLRALKPPE